ncbi:hypothetical protein ANRL1_03525 [Anaerolineae bacterium]|nr:hypothetical protein ANRL1_03525 [Anaerolineae bacterium]
MDIEHIVVSTKEVLQADFLASADAVYVLAKNIAIEYFDEGSLLLNLRDKSMLELDLQESQVLRCLDGQRTIGQLSDEYAKFSCRSNEQAARAVMTACEKLLGAKSLRLVQGCWKGKTMSDTFYMRNPDVNLREEDEDGALLFNPDSDRVQLLNSTGLHIWKFCAEKHTLDEIVAALKENFEDIPADAVAADVEEFVNQMVDSGFIGVVEQSTVA